MSGSIVKQLNSEGSKVLSALEIPLGSYRHQFEMKLDREPEEISETGSKWTVEIAAKSYATPTPTPGASADVSHSPVQHYSHN